MALTCERAEEFTPMSHWETRVPASGTCVYQSLAGTHGIKWAFLGMGRRDSWKQSCCHSSTTAGGGGKPPAARNADWHQISLSALFEQHRVQALLLQLNEDQDPWRPLKTHPLPQLPARQARGEHFSPALRRLPALLVGSHTGGCW